MTDRGKGACVAAAITVLVAATAPMPAHAADGREWGDGFGGGVSVAAVNGEATPTSSPPQNTASVPGTAERNDFFGARTKLLDVNGDGRPEPFVSATGENRDGGVWAFLNPVAAPTATGSVSFGAGTHGTGPDGSALDAGFSP
ncbi:hypothetical protein ABZ192_10425 [Streptomyces sp. NPDC006235]|uniref:hypothetical protein n=1 Tax=Streptomyces sp. NPDC006235 TaxID=3156736 RepID=UPI0033B5B288